jgi:hypothetical protein
MDELTEFDKWWKSLPPEEAKDKKQAKAGFHAGIHALREAGVEREDVTTTENYSGDGALVGKTVVTHKFMAKE